MFRLAKWYLDVVSDDGTVFIGYAARLQWRALRVCYGATLLSRPAVRLVERSTLSPGSGPVADADGVLRWRCRRLGVDGRWSPTAAPIVRRLYRDGTGAVDWECLVPAARVGLRVGSVHLEGWGYAERLLMTLPPWRLPIEELRWGRMVGPGAAAVWVDWRGPSPRRCVVVDGVEMADAEVSDDGLRLHCTDGFTDLRLHHARTLREGPLMDVLQAVPTLARALPHAMGAARETKWLSHGDIAGSGGVSSSAGWAIHEVVQWPARMPE